MQIRNLQNVAVEIVDPDTSETYTAAARPGTVEVPDKLARNLLKQKANWAAVDDKPKTEEKN